MAPSDRNARQSLETVTTSFLLDNLHCPTCVSTVKSVLHDSCADHVRWVSPNIVTSVVTVEHDSAATIKNMTAALEDAGFEVSGVTSSAADFSELDELEQRPPTSSRNGEASRQDISRPSAALGRWISASRLTHKGKMVRPPQEHIHLLNCEQCRKTKETGVDEKTIIEGKDTACHPEESALSHTSSTANPLDSLKSREAVMSTKSFITVDTEEKLQNVYRATLAVGGMTCAACVNTISNELDKKDWITKVSINLVSNSATVEFVGRENTDNLVEAIEDLGYDATIDKVVDLEEEKAPSQVRTVEILVDGTTIAYVSSVSQLIAAAANHPEEISDTNFYFDSVVFLTFFLLIGRLIESYSKSKTGDAVEALGKLRPTEATLFEKQGDKEKTSVVAADLLDFGDVVRVPHGGSPPADGTVVQGESSFDESSLTGESHLIKKNPGDQVFSGTVNKDAPILVQITGVSGQSMLDQIVNIVREGQTKRAPMEQIADLLTTYFVPIVTFVAILTWLIWLAMGLSGRIPSHYLDVSSGGWVAFSLQFAIAVFVVACPCGLGLAAPTAIFIGGGMAAKHGILAKGGGEAFEKASRIDCVVFDKTGTLTVGGQPTITDSEIFPDSTEVNNKTTESMLAALKAVEDNSSHPIAKAIVTYCSAKGLDTNVVVENLEEIPGKGMKAVYRTLTHDKSFEIIVGNEALLKDFSVSISTKVSEALQKWKTEAKSIALAATKPISSENDATISLKWSVAAALSISDPIREEAPAIVRALQSRGTRVWMLSGDNSVTASAVAARIGIPSDQVISGVLPAQKSEKITYLQSTLKARVGHDSESTTRRATVAMVGDGINDSPALTAADVGVAIGSGSDVAISSADFVLVKSDLRGIVTLLDLSGAVFRRIKFNFGWALIYNAIAVPVAAGALYPIMSNGKHVRLDPVWASLAMALSSISVVTSSLLLRSGLPLVGFRERTVQV
ncbi:putative copper-transporting atpase 1 protein [Phaeoacremonium minimum UCRPA7]|uniref:Putative copper-transporting atpase 1 protein n=1 Tax=Phaeoacremonium minimum (strain UCR-PA7) TaxID=1286976 RepID=R8BWI7_PHAM7|nr:putative copper-transporting atpase 1 protein [Phaeoacremonium minimum UCRPA7]EOO03707.1 putative copper-transporting atpase 1 protein [Phaeoacremonium minimum UCRPA7]